MKSSVCRWTAQLHQNTPRFSEGTVTEGSYQQSSHIYSLLSEDGLGSVQTLVIRQGLEQGKRRHRTWMPA